MAGMKLTITIDRSNQTIAVTSVEDAQEVYCKLREESGLGASTFGRGMVRTGRKLVASISYNGRVWDAKGNPVAADDVAGLDANIIYGAGLS